MILVRKLLFSGRQLVRRFSSEAPFREVSIPIPWGEIRGKWWGPTDVQPILTVHGWQDNCGSFDRLLPLLNKDVAFLAIDLPGHGFSSRLPVGVYYDYSAYILTLQYIVKYFQWPKLSLMGHSLGGIIAYTYTMLFPHKVDFTICLDGGKPLIVPNRIPLMAKYLEDFVKNNDYAMGAQEPPSYSLERMKQLVHGPNQNSVELQYTPYLMYRNIGASRQHPGKYFFTRDPRLRTGALMGFPQQEIVSHSQHISCPIFLSKSTLGLYYEEKEHFYQVLDVLRRSSRECAFHYVEGTHHAHLNNPEVMAQLVDGFIQRHNTERRTEGIRREIWVTEEQDPRDELPAEQIAVLRKAFEAFDSQKSGSIPCDMVADILRLMGQPFDKRILEELIDEVDADKSGRLEFEEFVTLAAKFIVEEDDEAMQKELKEAFRLYDKEGNGYIPTSCLKEILRELDDQLTDRELDMMIEEIDTDGSGTVDFDEFMEMMTGEV